jgi:hypothetical protein
MRVMAIKPRVVNILSSAEIFFRSVEARGWVIKLWLVQAINVIMLYH